VRRVAWAWASLITLVILVVLVLPRVAAAGPPEPTPTTDTVPAIELDEQGRVRVAAPTDEALRWYRTGNLLWIANSAWTLLVPLLILVSGASARMREWATKVARGRFARTTFAFVLAYLALTFVLGLPLSWYGGYVRPHAFGLSNQSFGKWFGDELISLAIAALLAPLFVLGTLAFVRRSPTRWWVWTSMVAVPLAFLLLMLAPVFVAPLFNDFGPMQDPALEADILALADRAGIAGSRVFEVDKSVDTKTVNAYVTGFASTKRIVLWDTIIAKLTREQLLVVMGHEMGHYVLGHVRNSMLALAVAIPLALWTFHLLATRILARFGARLRVTSLADVAALPLFLALVALLDLAVSPLANAWSRHQEHESDRFALELTHDNRACAEAFARLQQQNLGHPRPGPLFVIWRASHPPLGERIDFCNEYRPWERGEPERYAHHFTAPTE
jgi:Zn-dependent protease with chaperone function